MVLEKVSLKQNCEYWLRIPYGVEWRVRVELKSVKKLWFTIYVFILILIICFDFYIYSISVLKLVLFLNETYNWHVINITY